jgi:uncharacterized membrane protein
MNNIMSNVIKMFLVVILFISCSTNSNNNLKGTNWNLTIKGKAFDLINDSENQTTISFSEDKFILKENGESFQEGTYKILNKSRIAIKNIDGEYNGSINYNSEDNSFDLIFEGFSWRLDGISIKN